MKKKNSLLGKLSAIACWGLLLNTVVLTAQTSEGPNSGSTFSNEVFFGSSASWTNVDSAGVSDNERVSLTGALSSNGAYTDVFQALDFGFSIPAAATINGIIVEVERSDINNAKDNGIWIVKGGSAGSEDKSVNPAWSSEVYQDYGSSTDLWSETWTPADINASNFGVALSVKKQGGGANPEPKIDHVRITVHYTEPALPIELIDFDAEMLDDVVRLFWETSSEINNQYFTIERSQDLRIWEVVDNLDGAGNSNEMKRYESFDSDPLYGYSYYRLKQTDYDGTYKYFPEIVVENFKSKPLEVYPNPAEEIVIIKGIRLQEGFFRLSDANGRIVTDKIRLMASEAENSSKVDISQLHPGLYLIRVRDQETSFIKK